MDAPDRARGFVTIPRRTFLKTAGAAGAAASLEGILGARRAPAVAQGTKIHLLQWVDFIPEGACRVFHLEHGLEAVIPYLDGIVGNEDGPRFIGHNNKRDGKRARQAARAEPSAADLRMIESLYCKDFVRFGYTLEHDLPLGSAAEVPEAILAASRAHHRRTNRPLSRLASRFRRSLLR